MENKSDMEKSHYEFDQFIDHGSNGILSLRKRKSDNLLVVVK